MTDCSKCKRNFDGGCPYEDKIPDECKYFEPYNGDETPNYIG